MKIKEKELIATQISQHLYFMEMIHSDYIKELIKNLNFEIGAKLGGTINVERNE